MTIYDGPDFSEFPSEGATMTEPRKELFLHIGGPYDGAQMPVEVDSRGVPTETNTIHDITAPNMFLDPVRSIQVNRLTALYERTEELGADGVGYVFRYVVQNVTDLNKAA